MVDVKRAGGAAGDEATRLMIEIPRADAERLGREAESLGMRKAEYAGLLLMQRAPCPATPMLMETAELLRSLENSTESVAYELGRLFRLAWAAKEMEEKASCLKRGLEIFKEQEELIYAYLDLEREVRATCGALGKSSAAGCLLRGGAAPSAEEE